MTDQNAVPLIVMSPARDPVEAINSTLRRAGHPVHCTWIPALRDLADAITQINPELLVHVSGSEDLRGVITVRDQGAPKLPVIGIAESADESRIAEAMQLGARDFVSLSNTARLQAVMLPFPSVTIKPPAPITAEVVEPKSVKASVPVGRLVFDCANASPERVPLASISMNFKCVASIANTS